MEYEDVVPRIGQIHRFVIHFNRIRMPGRRVLRDVTNQEFLLGRINVAENQFAKDKSEQYQAG
jgi:hypothetical protein